MRRFFSSKHIVIIHRAISRALIILEVQPSKKKLLTYLITFDFIGSFFLSKKEFGLISKKNVN